MELVESKDGTKIAFERLGEGVPVVLVGGASCDRGIHAELAHLLAEDFMVINYDRRGRGDSGEKPTYAVEREIEDLDAVVTSGGEGRCCSGTRLVLSWRFMPRRPACQ